jgi:antitoxin component of RelBE/YafQ-DinJ toxin-antitoxin module
MSASAVLHSISESEETVTAEVKVSRTMKRDAMAFLAEHSLTLDDAFKMVIEAASMRMGVPSYWFGPNDETRESMAASDRGEVKRFSSIKDLMTDLNADD